MGVSIKAVVMSAAALAAGVGLWAGVQAADPAPSVKLNTTADHTKFKELQRTFASGPEVTKACLTCHTEAAGQIHRTKHWKWEFLNPENQQRLGKRNVLNNFCISVPSNYAFCSSCHVGYGMKDAKFDFSSQENVDCLVCHDTTGEYKKMPGGAGHPAYKDTETPPGSGKITKAVNLAEVARAVGKSSRDTCGACHFYGGGGDGVKHGDMDSSLAVPDKALDVHMDALGLDFTCGTCHKASSHDVVGSRYTPTAKGEKHPPIRGMKDNSAALTCNSCHGSEPHKGSRIALKLNNHTDKVACQTCHIPAFARGGVPTKMAWDWSTSGRRDPKTGDPLIMKDAKGRVIYDGKKGDFTLAENVKPEYAWFNGDLAYTLLGDKIDKANGVVGINRIGGDPTDGKSLIWPMKISRGKQPYDPVNQTLVMPHTAGNDDTAYWKNLVWAPAIKTAMDSVGAPFSGKVDFVETQMYWPITHMVAPKDSSVGCIECHAKDGRLEKITGVYIPGRDHNAVVEWLGWLAAGGAFGGIAVHGSVRALARRKRERKAS